MTRMEFVRRVFESKFPYANDQKVCQEVELSAKNKVTHTLHLDEKANGNNSHYTVREIVFQSTRSS